MVESHIKPPIRESSIGIVSSKGSHSDRTKKHALPPVVSRFYHLIYIFGAVGY